MDAPFMFDVSRNTLAPSSSVSTTVQLLISSSHSDLDGMRHPVPMLTDAASCTWSRSVVTE